MTIANLDMDALVEAYLEAAAWSSSAHTGEGDEDDERPLDDVMAEREIDWTDSAKKHARKVCEDFVALAFEICGEKIFDRFARGQWTIEECVGHDFWLTRMGHGAGFWDRGIKPEGDQLTKVADLFGEDDYTYVENGAVHFNNEATYKKPVRK